MITVTAPALWLACAFFLLTALFLPGVFAGYASTYRLPREDFFRTCGRNLWRFIRLMIIAGIVMGVIAGLLFAANGAIGTKAEESTNELLPFTLRMIGLLVIFLIMTTLRIWFDLAETDVVLNDERAVRRSIAAGFRHTFRSLGRLLGSYVLAAVIAAIILAAGLWFWMQVIPADSVARAFLLIQFIMLLLLIPRFWQRGMAVSYWQERMLVPVVEVHPVEPTIVPLAPAPRLCCGNPRRAGSKFRAATKHLGCGCNTYSDRNAPSAFAYALRKAFEPSSPFTHKFNPIGERPWLPLLRNCSLRYWLRRDAFRFSRSRILVVLFCSPPQALFVVLSVSRLLRGRNVAFRAARDHGHRTIPK